MIFLLMAFLSLESKSRIKILCNFTTDNKFNQKVQMIRYEILKKKILEDNRLTDNHCRCSVVCFKKEK